MRRAEAASTKSVNSDSCLRNTAAAAMLSFTKAMADVGVGDGVQVNAINPGAVRTARLVARLRTLSKEREIPILAESPCQDKRTLPA